MSWRDFFEQDEYQNMIKRNMDFCPVEVTTDEKTIIGTRSWEYVIKTFKEFPGIPNEPTDKDCFKTWDMINEKFVEINMNKVEKTKFTTYKGSRYLK